MKNQAVERALLTLLFRVNPGDFKGFEQVVGGDAFDDIRSRPPDDALQTLATNATLSECEDRFALVQALVLGTRIDAAINDEMTRNALDAVAARVLESVGADPDRRSDLRLTSGSLLSGIRLVDADEQAGFFAQSEMVLADLESAFAPWLTAGFNTVAMNHVSFTGRAAATAAMMMEATALYETQCTSAWKKDPYSKKKSTHVQIELCTSLSFAECSRRIDPTKWPECNPYFNSVTKLTPAVGTPQNWYGKIKEEVGPGLNFSYYKTDLKVRYVEQAGMVATAFDLVPAAEQTGDGRVTVDRGFLAVIEEGTHRRVQMVKVYRIEDQTGKREVPHDWVCPLWAQQMTLAGWSCGATMPMRRALNAWSHVMRDAVALAHCACGALYCDCADAAKKSKSGKSKKANKGKLTSNVAPLSPEQFDVPLPTACRASFTATTGQTLVAPPKSSAAAALQPGPIQVVKAEFGQCDLPPHDASSVWDAGNAVFKVALAVRDHGLYLGRLTAPGGVDVPFTLYDTGL